MVPWTAAPQGPSAVNHSYKGSDMCHLYYNAFQNVLKNKKKKKQYTEAESWPVHKVSKPILCKVMYCGKWGTTGGIQCRACRGTGSQEAWNRKTYQPHSSRKTCVGSCSRWLSLVFSVHSWTDEFTSVSRLGPTAVSEKMSSFFLFAIIRTDSEQNSAKVLYCNTG